MAADVAHVQPAVAERGRRLDLVGTCRRQTDVPGARAERVDDLVAAPK